MKFFVLAAIAFFLAGPAHATHEFSFALDAAATANNLLIADPPLPMLYYHKGMYKAGIKPYIFSGEQDFINSSPLGGAFRQTMKFDGYGGGASVSYAFAEKWGFYVFSVGSTMKGTEPFLLTGEGTNNPQFGHVEIRGAKASFTMLSLGMVRQFFGEEDGKFVLPVFAGPIAVYANFSQTQFERYSTQSGGATHTDFDMSGDQIFPGIMLGVQSSFNFNKYFQINPFLIGGSLFSDKMDFDVTNIRVDTQSATNPQSTLARIKAGEKIKISPKFVTIGINLVYRPWGLSFNVTSPIVKKVLLGAENLDVTQFSLSYAFGNYGK